MIVFAGTELLLKWPYHATLLFLMLAVMSFSCVSDFKVEIGMRSFNLCPDIHLIRWFWKTRILLRRVGVHVMVSEAYITEGKMYESIVCLLAFMERRLWVMMDFFFWKACQPLAIRWSTAAVSSALLLRILPIYSNCVTSSIERSRISNHKSWRLQSSGQ